MKDMAPEVVTVIRAGKRVANDLIKISLKTAWVANAT